MSATLCALTTCSSFPSSITDTVITFSQFYCTTNPHTNTTSLAPACPPLCCSACCAAVPHRPIRPRVCADAHGSLQAAANTNSSSSSMPPHTAALAASCVRLVASSAEQGQQQRVLYALVRSDDAHRTFDIAVTDGQYAWSGQGARNARHACIHACRRHRCCWCCAWTSASC